MITSKEINLEYSLEGLMLKLKLQYFGHLWQRTGSLEKTLMLGKTGQEEKGATEDEMVGWHHWLYGQEFEQAPGVGDGQGSLVCCSPWGCKELDTTEWLNLVKYLYKIKVYIKQWDFCESGSLIDLFLTETIYQKIHHFKVFNLAVFGTFTKPYNHQPY